MGNGWKRPKNREPASRLSFQESSWRCGLESCSICPMKVKMTEKSIGDRLIKETVD